MSHYDFVVDLVTRAGQMLRTASESMLILQKGSDVRDVVTSTDLELNTFLTTEIGLAYPDHRLYSEEGEGTEAASEYEWTIDPIDGSANFSRGIPHFAVCVGLLQNEMPIVGAVYNPITNELFSFEAGRGAFLNGTSIRVTSITEPSEAQSILVVGHQAPLWDWGAAVYRSFLEHMKKTKAFGSSALDLCFLAAGRADIVVYGTLTTRDVACAIGIVRAAGGEVYTLTGTPVALSATRQTSVATATLGLCKNATPLLHAEMLSR